MTTAQKIASIINASTKATGMTASVVDGKCIAHVPFQSSFGNGYESETVVTEAAAYRLIGLQS